MGEESPKPASTPKGAVFLSYASQDAAAAQRICAALRSADVETWFDQSELRGGDVWDRHIRRQIHDCALFVPVISANTQARLEGYFRLEWRLAVERTHHMAEAKPFLVPVVIDGTCDKEAEVPDSFRAVQWTRLPDGESVPAFVERVKRLLSVDGDRVRAEIRSPAAAALQQAVPSPIKSPITQRVPLVLAAIAVIGVSYVAVNKWWPSKRVAVSTQTSTAQAGAPAQSAIPEKSIAVLPFVDLSEKHDQEYFSDGLSEELIDRLAQNADLKVIARTSSFQFKGKSEDIRSIATKLGVANVLEGSVRKSGDALRITAQLIRAADATHLWSRTYARNLKDIFTVQDEIAGTVAQALEVALTRNITTKRGTPNIDAYNALLKGNFLRANGVQGGAAKALELYEEATRLDPDYALAWAKIGSVYHWFGYNGLMPTSEVRSKSLTALQRAISIDPNLGYAHSVLGSVYRDFDWDWTAAESEFRKAAALDPNDLDVQADLGYLTWMQTGKIDQEIDAMRRALLRDPLDLGSYFALGISYWAAGRYEESERTYANLLQLNPGFEGGWAWYGAVLMFTGKLEKALDAVNKESDESSRLGVLSCVYWKMGRHADSNAALEQLEKKNGRIDAYDIARRYACRGEDDAAIEWLNRAYEQRSADIPNVKFDPYFLGLNKDPRFQTLLVKLNLSGDGRNPQR